MFHTYFTSWSRNPCTHRDIYFSPSYHNVQYVFHYHYVWHPGAGRIRVFQVSEGIFLNRRMKSRTKRHSLNKTVDLDKRKNDIGQTIDDLEAHVHSTRMQAVVLTHCSYSMDNPMFWETPPWFRSHFFDKLALPSKCRRRYVTTQGSKNHYMSSEVTYVALFLKMTKSTRTISAECSAYFK